MVSSMSRLTKDAKPTAFHHMLATIAKEDRLLRLYSQNVDGIDTALEPLKTFVPLRKDEDGKWPRTVQLHGGLDKMVCSKCHEISEFDADLFSGSMPPLCRTCEEINDIRTNHEGKRSHGIGRLRPRMVLYNEHNPDDEAIGTVTREDLRRRPDAVLVVGTTLKVPGVRRIVREMCGVVRDRRGGVAIWINNDLPPVAKDLEDCFDIVVQGTCDEVATRAAMRKWDEPEDDFSEISDEDAKKAEARMAEVHVPQSKCDLKCLDFMELPSSEHFNNSYLPPMLADPVATPKKELPPPDWSPLSTRRPSVLQSIEQPEGENIVVVNTGLLTPTKSQKSTPPKIPSITDKLKDAGKPRKLGSKSSKATTTAAKLKKSVKYVKPAKSKSKTTLNSSAPTSNGLIDAFKASKSTTVEAKTAVKKSSPLPYKSPSKLRLVSNAGSTEPMHHISPNTSPSKPRPVFPGLMAENASQEVKKRGLN